MFKFRFSTSLFHFQLIDGAEHEGPLPPEHDGGAVALACRLHGRAVHQLPHDQTLRRIPILHKRNPLDLERKNKLLNCTSYVVSQVCVSHIFLCFRELKKNDEEKSHGAIRLSHSRFPN